MISRQVVSIEPPQLQLSVDRLYRMGVSRALEFFQSAVEEGDE